MVIKKELTLNKFDTNLALYLTNSYTGNQLDIKVEQRTDTTYSTCLIFNHVTKEDMLKLSEIFRDFAGAL